MFPKIFERISPERIPRTGEEGRNVNCYSVMIDKSKEPYFIARSFDGEKIIGFKWNEYKYDIEAELNIHDLSKYKLRVTHYYGLNEITYDTIGSIVFHYITKIIYIRVHIDRFINSTTQYFYNKKKFHTKSRMELLQFMLDKQLKEYGLSGFNLFELMIDLYSIRWVSHPSSNDQLEKLKIYLESLQESGEIKKESHNSKYKVLGKAIVTLEKYEEEDRRHVRTVKLQRGMLWLTIIIALASLIQSEIIKIPTLIDFTK